MTTALVTLDRNSSLSIHFNKENIGVDWRSWVCDFGIRCILKSCEQELPFDLVIYIRHNVLYRGVVRHLLRTDMNKIKGQLDKSDYEGYSDFVNFLIDDYLLDEKLDEYILDKCSKD